MSLHGILICKPSAECCFLFTSSWAWWCCLLPFILFARLENAIIFMTQPATCSPFHFWLRVLMKGYFRHTHMSVFVPHGWDDWPLRHCSCLPRAVGRGHNSTAVRRINLLRNSLLKDKGGLAEIRICSNDDWHRFNYTLDSRLTFFVSLPWSKSCNFNPQPLISQFIIEKIRNLQQL